MLRALFFKRLFFGIFIFGLLVVMGWGLFYGRKIANQAPVKVYKPVEVARPTAPKPPPPGETHETGHWHGDEWHSEPHDPPVPAAPTQTQQTPTRGTQVGYWANGVYHRPAGYMPPYPRGQTSSNPYFKDGVPEHLKCPEKWIGVYAWASGEYSEVDQKMRQIYREVMEQYNPNRPIHEVWPRFIEAELFYQANADIPPLDPERYTPGSFDEWSAAPEVSKGAGRIDWLIQNALDYPEVVKLSTEDSTTCNNAWRMELGFDKPDWNVVTLLDGRKFRSRSDHRYEFTFTEGNQTFTSKYQHSGGA